MADRPLSDASRRGGLNRPGVRARLGRAFALQIALISVAVVGGVFATAWIVEDVLSREALAGEAKHFWTRYANDPAQPLPDTDNMLGYLSRAPDRSDVPVPLRGLHPGLERVTIDGEQPLVYVEDGPPGRLYLLFKQDEVSELTLYFGVLPLAIILLFIYALSFVSYRLSQRAVSPLVGLAARLEGYDPLDPDDKLKLDDLRASADAEVTTMIDALADVTGRLERFVARERNFTRDASHELRTPLAVIKANLDLLERTPDRPEAERQSLLRMRRTVAQMQALIESLLMLARETDMALPASPVSVNRLVAEQVELFTELAQTNRNVIEVHDDALLEVRAPPHLIGVALANLLRNALGYTRDGRITVSVLGDRVEISDTGIGMTDADRARLLEPFFRGEASRASGTPGHGLGLAIVGRLIERFGWRLEVVSAPGRGTTVQLIFPDHSGANAEPSPG